PPVRTISRPARRRGPAPRSRTRSWAPSIDPARPGRRHTIAVRELPGPLLLVVPTDSATSAAPRPCAVPQTLGQDQRRGVLAGRVLEGDVDCALRAPIARRRRPTRRQGDAVTSQIDRSLWRGVASPSYVRTSLRHRPLGDQ